MATPTERLTARTAEVLGEDVRLAMRVHFGEAGKLAKLSGATRVITAVMAAILPVIWAFRLLIVAKERLFGTDPRYGVLAILPSGERVLLSTSALRRLHPSSVIKRIPAEIPIQPNLTLMGDAMIAEIDIADHTMVVNGTDFKRLLKSVREGEIDAPLLHANLNKLVSHTARWAKQEPEQYVGRKKYA